MILLLTDGGRKTRAVEDIIVGTVKEEFEMFRKEFNETSLKLLTLSFGRENKYNKFLKELTRATVRAS